jgi:hypothetical protein
MFDSPFEYCTVCRKYVVLDQTQRECAREHRCGDVVNCPLRRCFSGIEFRETGPAEGRSKKTPSTS